MGTLQTTDALRDISIVAADGHLGYVTDACFDDRHWIIRHLLVNTESTLPHGEVLIPPSSLLAADWKHHTLSIGLTRQQAWAGTAIEAMRLAMGRHANREPQLHNCEDVVGFDVLTSDEPIGHIEDLLFDEEHWKIGALVVDTRNWWPGRKIAVAPHRIIRASWPAMMIVVDVARRQFESSGGENGGERIAAGSRNVNTEGRRPRERRVPGMHFAARRR